MRAGLARWLPHLGLLLLACLLVGLQVRAVPQLSPIDEFQHADALHRAIHGRLVRTGDVVDPSVRAAASCRGVESVKLPPCGAPRAAVEYPDAGFDTADIHPPGYYLITAAVSAPLRWLGVNEIDAGRLAGALWLAAALVLLWELAVALGAAWAGAAAACVLAATTTAVLGASSALGPDASALAAGGLAMLGVIRVRDRRWPAWTLVAAGGFAGVTKAHNLVAVLAASIQRLVPGEQPERGRALVEAGLLAGSAAAFQGAWLLLRHALAHPGVGPIPLSQAEFVSSLQLKDVVLQVVQFVTPVNSPYTPGLLDHWQVGIIHYVLNVILTGAVFGGVLFLASGGAARTVAIGAGVTALLGGPLLVVATYLSTHSFVPSFPRYGLSLLPGMFALLAAGSRRPVAVAGTALLALASLGAVLAYLVPAALR